MMEDASGSGSSASLLQRSPQILNNESPQLEPMAADAKILPKNYSECEFADLVELIGMLLRLTLRPFSQTVILCGGFCVC
jgi:hypothetical protein